MAKEYWWVSVGGNKCEPAVIVKKVGKFEQGSEVIEHSCYTFGCPDPFDLLKDKRVVLVEEMGSAPPTPAEKEKARKEFEEYKRKHPEAVHGYRTFD